MNKTVTVFDGKRIILLYLCLIIISVGIRLVNLNIPILESFGFRQTQTAITVQNYNYEGISLWDYKTPVFGYPYKVPFEFPVFQISALVVNRYLVDSLDLAMRLTNMGYFYISAWLLYLICIRILKNNATVLTIITVYLMNPYSIFWSRTSMIDFCSVAFGMAYFYLVVRWIESRNGIFVVPGIIMGSFGYLSKATSMLPIVVLLGSYILYSEFKSIGPNIRGGIQEIKRISSYFVKGWWRYSQFLLLIIVPVYIGYEWVAYTDTIKILSGQEWLTSKSLATWNYGTVSQKISFSNWGIIADRVAKHMFPTANMFFLISLPFTVKYMNIKEKWVSILSLIAAFVTIFVFFNLYYVHNYYLIALVPYLAIAVGINVKFLLSKLLSKRNYVIVIFIGILSFIAYVQTPEYFDIIKDRSLFTYSNNSIVQLGNYIESITDYEDNVIITDYDWSSEILYYSSRKGLMLRSDLLVDQTQKKENNFKIIVTKNLNQYPLLLSSFEKLIYLKDISGFSIYAIDDDDMTLSDNVYKKTISDKADLSSIQVDVTEDAVTNIDVLIQNPTYGVALKIQGWGILKNTSSVNQIIIVELIDSENNSYFFDTTKVIRSDVGEFFSSTNYDNSGFDCTIRSDSFLKGEYQIKIYIKNQDHFFTSNQLYNTNIQEQN